MTNHTLINLLTGELLTRDMAAAIYAADPGYVANVVTALGRFERVPGLVSAAFAHYGRYCERCRSTHAVRAVETGEMLCFDCRTEGIGDAVWAWADASFDQLREDGRRW